MNGTIHKTIEATCTRAPGGSYDFTISTPAVDRDNDTIAVNGWKLDEYRKNPVVLWCHDSRGLPIGKAEAVRVEGGRLRAKVRFASQQYPFAKTVEDLIAGGFLRTTSVGFKPIKYKRNEERGGYDFQEQALLEFSLVPIPSNPQALMDAKAAGIDLRPLQTWAQKILAGTGRPTKPTTDDVQRLVETAVVEGMRRRQPRPRVTAQDLERLVTAAAEKAVNALRGRLDD